MIRACQVYCLLPAESFFKFNVSLWSFENAVSAIDGLVALLLPGAGIVVAELSVLLLLLPWLLLSQEEKNTSPDASTVAK